MPNHFHVLVSPLVEHGLSTYMAKIGTSYSMYFNKKYQRTGTLYEGKFKTQWVDDDTYCKYLYAYIHLNPVKLLQPDWKERGVADPQAAYKYAASYAYSSLPDYLGVGRVEGKIISPQSYPGYFNDMASHRDELFSWLSYKNT
jgi:putative transposase